MTTPINQRWSHIYNAWIEPSSWNDREEIARLNSDLHTLRSKLAMPAAPVGDEIIDAQHVETGRMWRGPRSQLPSRFLKVTIFPDPGIVAAPVGDDARQYWVTELSRAAPEVRSSHAVDLLVRQAARIAELERERDYWRDTAERQLAAAQACIVAADAMRQFVSSGTLTTTNDNKVVTMTNPAADAYDTARAGITLSADSGGEGGV